jgi:hypothetical protein
MIGYLWVSTEEHALHGYGLGFDTWYIDLSVMPRRRVRNRPQVPR